MAERRRTSWVALGAAGAIGAAAMYGATRMNRNNGWEQMADQARNVIPNQPMQQMGSSIQDAGNQAADRIQETWE
ncbi:hypothetical protein EQV77_09595 [Halobacillus fulvus]|nr:hypothetical protein EQV77_09595 [Halobacillus fulvus]